MSTFEFEPRPASVRRPGRFVAFGLVAIIVVASLSVRLFTLQVGDAQQFRAQTRTTTTVNEARPSTRGLIYDRAGRLLVTNVPTWTVRIRPGDLQLSQREQVVGRLATLLHMTPTEINTIIDATPGSRFDLVRIKQDVPEDIARLISEERLELPGVEVAVEARRSYPYGALVSQVLGYTGAINAQELARLRDTGYQPDDLLGKAGVESVYETALRGSYGIDEVERDAAGRKIQVLASKQEPVAGSSIVLTIDTKEQKLAEKALRWGMQAAGLKRGVVIVMNPQTGEILAMVSLPTYDNNLFARGISGRDFTKLVTNANQPLLNHAIAEQYPPGSTYKLVAGTGALADKKITASTKIMTKSFLRIGPYRYYEWNRRGWGPLTILNGFGHSSDTFFFQLAGFLGIDRLGYWANQYGFGKPTGIDLPGEVAGIVPTNRWKQDTFGQSIFPGETYQAGIGQGYDVVTPMQLINAYAALANGGKLYQPQVVRQIVGPDGTVTQPYQKKLIRKLPVSASVLRTMRLAARRVVTIRHTYNLVDLPVVVAGKSGTAEFGTRDSKGRLPFHSWFVAFVPKSGDAAKPDAQLAVLAFAYDSRTKGNVATEIVKYYLQLHFNLKVDLRIKDLTKRGNFYQSN